MKLETLDVLIVKNPPPGHGGRYFIFVILKTACGIKGVGEVYAATFGPDVVKAMIEDVFARYLEGTSPHQIERFWRRTHGSGFTHRPDLSMQGVVSGLEMACWDIIGKAADRPVYDLLGGKVHDRLRSYTYLYPNDDQDPGSFYSDPVASAETAALAAALALARSGLPPSGARACHWPSSRPARLLRLPSLRLLELGNGQLPLGYLELAPLAREGQD